MIKIKPKKKNKKKRTVFSFISFAGYSSGYVALTSVLLLGALILVIGISVIITSTGEVDAGRSYKNSRQAVSLANSCAEIGIARAKSDSDYQGRERIAVGDYSCNIFAVADITGGKTFDVTGRIDDFERKLRVRVMDDLSFSITPL